MIIKSYVYKCSIIVRNWKFFKCLILRGCFKKLEYIYMVEYLVVIKYEGFLIVWGNLIILKMLSKESIFFYES